MNVNVIQHLKRLVSQLVIFVRKTCSKIVEKAVLSQLFKHCEGNGPLANLQSGFRRFHSTETALLKVQSDILMSMDRQEITLLVLLDLSAAFDTIDRAVPKLLGNF